MSSAGCQREKAVVAAVRSGQWTEELRSHFAQCDCCAEAVLVAQFLHAEAASTMPPLPDAGQVWWRAQIRARQAAAERATRPVRLFQKISIVCALASAVALLLRYAPQLQGWAEHLSDTAGGSGEPLVWTLLATGVVCVAAMSAGLSYLLHS